jgi:uncharacterized protein YdhG (YjbR/CyaY superfamily)
MASTGKSTGAGDGTGFTDAEKAAMRARAEELRHSGRGGNKKADNFQDALDKMAEMSPADRALAERVHAVVTATAPDLEVKTWYGQPAYARDGQVLCFFQAASKFDTRYCTFGFNEVAQLDDGAMWPVAFALVEWTDEVEARLADLVSIAVG